MPHLQYANFSDMVMADSVSASSDLLGYPSVNVKSLGKPFRSWRSASPTDQWLRYEWSVQRNIVGVFINNVVAGRLEIRTAPSIGGAETSRAILNPMPKDPRVVRGKYLQLFPTPVVAQTVALYPTVPIDVTHQPGYEIGDVVPVTAWRHFPDHFETPLAWRRMQSITTSGVLGGGTQQQQEGRAYVQLQLNNSLFIYPALQAFLAELNRPPGEPILIFEDVLAPDLSQAYLMARLSTQGDEVNQRITTFQGALVYEELI